MKELKTWKEVVQALLDGKQVEVFNSASGKWVDVLYFPNFRSAKLLDTAEQEYRIKPRTIMIGDMEVPEPVRDAREMAKGEPYYFPSLDRNWIYDVYIWDGDDLDLQLLKYGLVHKTKEGAMLHAKALIKISGGSYE